MKKRKIAVGIVGAGYIAQQAHIPAYLANPNVEIIGIADVNKMRLEEVKRIFGVQNVYSDFHELFEESLDAISICIPTKFHSKIAVEAASKGLHVLCEKPIALTLEEAKEMIETCERNDVQLMVGFNYRFIKTHQEAKKMLERGRIGKPFFIHGQFASQGPYENFEQTKKSFYFDPESGGGVLFDSGSHIFDLIRWYFGEIKEVKAVQGTYVDDISVDDVTSVSVKFESGRVGSLTCMWTKIDSWSAMGDEGFIKIIGDEGKIVTSLFSPSIKFFSKRSKLCKLRGTVELVPKGLDPKRPMEALERSWRKEINAFVEAVRTNSKVPVSGCDGKRALELVLEARKSAEV